ncbi:MAG: hypothetical protein ABFD64_00255 [Armatimonadota bacterium]
MPFILKLKRRLAMFKVAILQPVFYLISDEAGDNLYLRFIGKYGIPDRCQCGKTVIGWLPVGLLAYIAAK